MVHNSKEPGIFRSITRYDEYYLPGGDLFLVVEDRIFRVHRYFFERESVYFKGKLATPPSPGSTRPGTSESNYILLDDVRVHEFARFLWVFYNPKYSLYQTSVADWTAILNLAHCWSFPEVKALAVRELERQSMPDIERVVIYQDNDVDRNLLIRCYAALCERDEPITHAEGRRMGIETALTIAHLREMARRSPIDCRSPGPPTPSNFRGTELLSLVRELFSIVTPITGDYPPQTPIDGPTPRSLESPVPRPARETAPLQSPPRRTGAKPTVQIVTPATTPPLPPVAEPSQKATPPVAAPLQTATPPIQAAQSQETEQEQEAQSQGPSPAPASVPPPVPEKTERPQVTTHPLDKVNPLMESRPSTPASETPTTGLSKEEKKKRRKAKKAAEKAAERAALETGTATPKTDEKINGEVAPAATEEGVDTTQQENEGDGAEKKGDDQALVDLETKGEEVPGAGEEEEKEKEAGSSGTPDLLPPAGGDAGGEKAKATDVTGGDGVSTDIPSKTADLLQVNGVKTDSKASPSVPPNPLEPSYSPTTRRVPVDRNEFLKTPVEKAKSSSLIDSIWNFTSPL